MPHQSRFFATFPERSRSRPRQSTNHWTFSERIKKRYHWAPKCLSCANRHCACAISRDLCPLCKIWVGLHIWISHPHIAYSLYDIFIGLRWITIRGVYSWDSECKAKSSENFLSPNQIWANFGRFGSLGSRYKSFWFFTAKGTSVCESTSFEPFCVKIGWGPGLTPRRVPEKSKKVTDSHVAVNTGLDRTTVQPVISMLLCNIKLPGCTGAVICCCQRVMV